ncbi:MAG: DUF805 domain-containing protein [Pseudomonadota bacterium]
MIRAVVTCFRKTFTYTGRAGRPAFWWFFLFTTLVELVPVVPLYVLLEEAAEGWLTWLYLLVLLVTVPPTVAVTWRRFHDMDRSGLWTLALMALIFAPEVMFLAGTDTDASSLVALAGSAWWMIWMAFPGTEGENRFGRRDGDPDPVEAF